MNQTTKGLLRLSAAFAACGLTLLVGCAGEPETESQDLSGYTVQKSGDMTLLTRKGEAAPSAPEGTRGESHAKDALVDKRDCAFIQWCNAPGWEEVVCVIRPECNNQPVYQECVDDAYYVCGPHRHITFR